MIKRPPVHEMAVRMRKEEKGKEESTDQESGVEHREGAWIPAEKARMLA